MRDVENKDVRNEWRKLADKSMVSYIGEFIALLDYVDELEARLAECTQTYVSTSHDIDISEVRPSPTEECPHCDRGVRSRGLGSLAEQCFKCAGKGWRYLDSDN